MSSDRLYGAGPIAIDFDRDGALQQGNEATRQKQFLSSTTGPSTLARGPRALPKPTTPTTPADSRTGTRWAALKRQNTQSGKSETWISLMRSEQRRREPCWGRKTSYLGLKHGGGYLLTVRTDPYDIPFQKNGFRTLKQDACSHRRPPAGAGILRLRYASAPRIEAAAKFTIATVRYALFLRNPITWLAIQAAFMPPLMAAPFAPNVPPPPANTRLPSFLLHEELASAMFATANAATLAIHSARPAWFASTFDSVRGAIVAANSLPTAVMLTPSSSWAAATPCNTRSTAAHLTNLTTQL